MFLYEENNFTQNTGAPYINFTQNTAAPYIIQINVQYFSKLKLANYTKSKGILNVYNK